MRRHVHTYMHTCIKLYIPPQHNAVASLLSVLRCVRRRNATSDVFSRHILGNAAKICGQLDFIDRPLPSYAFTI